MPKFDYDISDFKKKKLMVDIKGKAYLTVQGRLVLAHQSGQLAGVEVDQYHDGEEYIIVKANVIVINPNGPALLERLAAAGIPLSEDIVSDILFNTYEGYAKSPKEGSEAWKKLKENSRGYASPELTNPLEVASTSAIGRALGAAGFGETESFATAEEVTIGQSRSVAMSDGEVVDDPSPAQKKMVFNLAKQKAGVTTTASFDAWVSSRLGKVAKELSKGEVSTLIDELKAMPAPSAGAQAETF